jgi:hypothetical protein
MVKALLFPSGRSVRVLYEAVNKERQFESVLSRLSSSLLPTQNIQLASVGCLSVDSANLELNIFGKKIAPY